MISNSIVLLGATLAACVSGNQEVPELVNRVKEKLANVDQLVENMAQEHEDMLNKVTLVIFHYSKITITTTE